MAKQDDDQPKPGMLTRAFEWAAQKTADVILSSYSKELDEQYHLEDDKLPIENSPKIDSQKDNSEVTPKQQDAIPKPDENKSLSTWRSWLWGGAKTTAYATAGAAVAVVVVPVVTSGAVLVGSGAVVAGGAGVLVGTMYGAARDADVREFTQPAIDRIESTGVPANKIVDLTPGAVHVIGAAIASATFATALAPAALAMPAASLAVAATTTNLHKIDTYSQKTLDATIDAVKPIVKAAANNSYIRTIAGVGIAAVGVVGAVALSGATFGVAPAVCLALGAASVAVGAGVGYKIDQKIYNGYKAIKDRIFPPKPAKKNPEVSTPQQQQGLVNQAQPKSPQKQPLVAQKHVSDLPPTERAGLDSIRSNAHKTTTTTSTTKAAVANQSHGNQRDI
ncbi:MAG: hypothetical protein K9G11_00810 [Rickettsiaceae bacterium]|nr:hypothetical protein [Rickettsiaceae bacterium]